MGSQTDRSACSFHARRPHHQSREPSFSTDAAQTLHAPRGKGSHFWQTPALSNMRSPMLQPCSPLLGMWLPTSPAQSKVPMHPDSNVPPLHQTQSTCAPPCSCLSTVRAPRVLQHSDFLLWLPLPHTACLNSSLLIDFSLSSHLKHSHTPLCHM